MKVLGQIGRFGLVGLLNSLITLLVIAVLGWLGTSPFVANALGYAAGLINSYFLNMNWTFRSEGGWTRSARFLSAFALCYTINAGVLYVSLPLAAYQILIPQLIAVASYTSVFFILSRAWVFKH